MPNGTAQSSDAILAAARASLKDQRAGGRRVSGKPIGKASAAMRRQHQFQHLRGLLLWMLAIVGVTMFAGWAIRGVSFLTVITAIIALVIVARVMRRSATTLTVPDRAELQAFPTPALIGKVQLWLEAQRPALPAPAVMLVEQIGGQLDLLGGQLAKLSPDTPAAGQVHLLLGEHLPDLITSYTAIPAPLRQQDHAGQSPDQQLTEGLTRISGEIDGLVRQLAEGSLDRLAIQTRFLDYKYGTGPDGAA